jgi:hypothetical protein
MPKDQISRQDFIRQTVANTLDTYLRIYCAPYTISEAQTRCIRDAEKLADEVYGVIDVGANDHNTSPSNLSIIYPRGIAAAQTALARFQTTPTTVGKLGPSMQRRLKR